MSWDLWFSNALPVSVMMVTLWCYSVVKKDVSIVDPWWSVGYLLVAWNTFLKSPSSQGKLLLLSLVSIWALRLWSYLVVRNWDKGEDPRYRAFRERFGPENYWWVSFFQVFGLQGLLILIISWPLQTSLSQPLPDPVVPWDLVGAVLALTGITLETIADAQMADFKKQNKSGEVLDSGLWRYSRHPNYFGECLLWWGFWLFSLDTGYGHLTISAPLLMTYLLLRVSGVTMLESQLQDTKPAYRDYVRKTSAFVPWPPSEEREK